MFTNPNIVANMDCEYVSLSDALDRSRLELVDAEQDMIFISPRQAALKCKSRFDLRARMRQNFCLVELSSEYQRLGTVTNEV